MLTKSLFIAKMYYLESLESQNDLYDLYAVVNHLGGMSGGHYTAYVKCTSPPTATRSSSDFLSDLSSPSSLGADIFGALDAARYSQYAKSKAASLDGNWYLFDDDVVRPVPLQELENLIVSGMCICFLYNYYNIACRIWCHAWLLTYLLTALYFVESAYILFYRRRVFKSSTTTLLSP